MREFNVTFATLRTTVIKRLEAIKASLHSASPAPLAPQQLPRSPLLYFHAPLGPDNVRMEVENELRGDGYRIVPAVPRALSNELAHLQAEVNAKGQVPPEREVLPLLRPTND